MYLLLLKNHVDPLHWVDVKEGQTDAHTQKDIGQFYINILKKGTREA